MSAAERTAESYCVRAAQILSGTVTKNGKYGQPTLSVVVLGRPYSTWRDSWEELASALGILLDIDNKQYTN